MTSIPDYQTIRSSRRTIGIQIQPPGVVIVRAPYLIPQFIIRKFVSDHLDWILENLAKFKNLPKIHNPALKEGSEMLYLGKNYPIHIGKYPKINVQGRLNIPDFLEFRLKKELTNWYIQQAKTVITSRVEYYSKVMQTSFRKIVYSDTSSKWGSCSPDNLLQFNWRLIMAPLLVLDYVVVHELVHTRIKNHQKGFWEEVKIYKPAYKQYIKWLRTNSQLVHSQI
jgi:predicted metal-dependent hydrolase